VFVHGLTGNRETTWTHSNGTFWPRDLLAQAISNARIMTFGYDANVVRLWSIAGSSGLYDHGKSLEYQLDHARSRDSSRPIFFVAHSLGGLVCEQALLLGDATRQSDSIVNNTKGILFMGTPHYGSSLASWGSILAKFAHNFRATNKEIVATLKRGSSELQRVGEEFQLMLRRPDVSIEVVCFYEELPTPTLGKIVESESAVLRGYRNCSIHANHRDMTKFSGSTDIGYTQVRATLTGWVGALQPLQIHDTVDEGERSKPRDASSSTSPGANNTPTTAPGVYNYGSVSGRNVLQGQQLSGGTNTWNFN
jgi:protein SERAC1